ncbi:MAG TPA: antA/AntB antirepressor family protein [Adhaeribacter sp.]|nr:antA/AntB antirepressor family protein [Adhaeribacter sp.]
MIEIQYSQKGSPYIWASELHQHLSISASLDSWFPEMIEFGFIENQDYRTQIRNSKTDWAVHIDMAKYIAKIHPTEQGRSLRQQLMSLNQMAQDGAYLSHRQILGLFDLCRVLGYFSVENVLEQESYYFLDKPQNWWQYRARLFDIPAENLKEMVLELGKKYRDQKHTFATIDKYELIRQAIIDLLTGMGKSRSYALNVSAFAREIARQLNPDIYNVRHISEKLQSKAQLETLNFLRNRQSIPSLLDRV